MPVRPTQRDVAARARVSTATVSYILSGRRGFPKPVSDETRDRVLAAAEALGYQRNHVARSLRRQRTELVSVVYRLPSSPWLESLVEQLHDTALARGYSLITVPLTRGESGETALRVLRERYVDGAILVPNHHLGAEDLRSLARSGLVLVVFDDDLAPSGFDVIRQDVARSCQVAVEHLIQRGHTRIAYFGHGTDRTEAMMDARFAGYRRAFEAHGVPLDESLVLPVADSRPRALRAASQLLADANRPTAVFSASDRAAVQVISAAHGLRLAIPRDLAVVGVGNTEEGATISPSLTSVGTPTLDFTAGIDRLFGRIDAPRTGRGKQIQLSWRLIRREST